MNNIFEKYRDNAVFILAKSVNQPMSRRTFDDVQRKAVKKTKTVKKTIKKSSKKVTGSIVDLSFDLARVPGRILALWRPCDFELDRRRAWSCCSAIEAHTGDRGESLSVAAATPARRNRPNTELCDFRTV